MTPQEENIESQRRAKEEQDRLTEANKSATDATDKARAANLKIEQATYAVVGQFQKLLDVQLRYQVAMAKGEKGAAQFNDSVDLMTDTMQMAVTALSLLVPGGILIKGVVAGLTFLATNALKTSAAMQKAANEQGDALKKSFDAMSKAGATSSDGMTGLFKDVNRMRLNVHQLDAMTSIMANSAKEMSSMGGTVYKARKEFGDLVQGMGAYEKGLLNLGMSYDDQAEAAMGYMKLQSNLSQGQQRDYGKLSGGLKKYLEETEALARVTGMNRKEQEAAQEKYMAQQRFGAKVQELRDNGQNEAAEMLLSQMKKYAAKGDMFAQAFADSTTGMLTSDAAIKGNMSSNMKIMEDAQNIVSGRIKTEQEANESFQGVERAVKATTKAFNMSYQAGVAEDFLLPFKEGAEITKGANQDFAKQMKDAEAEVKKLINDTSDVDVQLKRFNRLLKNQNDDMLGKQKALDDKFMDSGAATGGMLDRLNKAIAPLMKVITFLVDAIMPLLEIPVNMFVDALNVVVKLLTGDFVGAFEDFGSFLMDIPNGLAKFSIKIAEGITDLIKHVAGNLLKTVEFFTGPLGPVFENVGKVVSGFGDGVKNGLANLDKFIEPLTKGFIGLSDVITPILDAPVKAFTNALSGVNKLLTGDFTGGLKDLGQSFMDIPEGIAKSLLKTVELITGPLTKEFKSMVEVITPILEAPAKAFNDALSGVNKLLTGDFIGGFKDLGKAVMDVPEGIVKSVLKTIELFTGPLKPIFDNVCQTISGFGDCVKTGITKFTDSLTDMIKDIWAKMIATIPGLGTAAKAVGNVAGTVSNAASTAGNYVSSLIGGKSATAPATASAAPAGGKPATAAPATASASPAGGKPATAAPATASAAPAGGPPATTAAAAVPAKNVPAGDSTLAKFTALSTNISKFESGAAGYNAYNKGTVGNKMIGSDKPIDFSAMTIAEFLRRGSLTAGDPDRIFAMGKYQIIPPTMESLVKKLKLDPATTVLDPTTQDLLFTEGLVNQTRTNVAAYLSGKSDNRDAAILDLAKEFASVGVPYPAGKAKERGESYYAGVGGNKAHNSPDQVGAALDADRQNKVSAADGGMFSGPMSGYSATLHGNEAVIPLKNGAVPVTIKSEMLANLLPKPDMDKGDTADQAQNFNNNIGGQLKQLVTEIIAQLRNQMPENNNQELVQLMKDLVRGQQRMISTSDSMLQVAQN